jgi:hypothetical protein
MSRLTGSQLADLLDPKTLRANRAAARQAAQNQAMAALGQALFDFPVRS